MIGFASFNREMTDYYFNRFKYWNSDQIDRKKEAYNSFYLLDGTFIKKIYDIDVVKDLFTFDQFILCGPLNLIYIRESVYRSNLRWNQDIPEEFRIIRMNEY